MKLKVQLVWIILKILNKVIGFVRFNIKVIIFNNNIKESYAHFHSFDKAINEKNLRKSYEKQLKKTIF